MLRLKLRKVRRRKEREEIIFRFAFLKLSQRSKLKVDSSVYPSNGNMYFQAVQNVHIDATIEVEST